MMQSKGYVSVMYQYLLFHKRQEGTPRFEPGTCWSAVSRSATELRTQLTGVDQWLSLFLQRKAGLPHLVWQLSKSWLKEMQKMDC